MRRRFERRWGVSLTIALAIAVGFRHGESSAAEPRTIVRVRSSSPPLDERLDAELSTLGFAVKVVDGVDPAADLGAIAHDHGAVAAVRVDSDDAVELWVEGRAAGDPPTRETVHADARRRGNVVTVLALEALRAHLLELPREPVLAPRPPKLAETAVVAPPPPPPPTPRPRLWLDLGAGADASPGGVSPGFEVLLAVRLEPRPWLSLGAFGAVTPLATRLDAAEGSALLRRTLGGIGLDLQKHVSRVSLSVGVGGAFVITSVEGTSPSAGYAARDATTVTAAPVLRSAASVGLTRALRVRLEIAAGVSFPPTTISFGEREEATWGRPFGLLTLGAEWGAL